MQKKLIALAIAGLASSAAFAQSNVTVYGVADVYAANSNASGRVVRNAVQSGGLSGSRIGFKGVEDLGNGTKALFTLEYAIAADDNTGIGTGTAAARQQFVGLTGAFGTAVAGRLQTAGYDFSAATNALHGTGVNPLQNVTKGFMGSYTLTGLLLDGSIIGQSSRASNAIAYISPSFGGVTIAVNHARLTETATNLGTAGTSDSNANLISATYNGGPAVVSAIYSTIALQKGTGVQAMGFNGAGVPTGLTAATLAAEKHVTEWALGGSYDFGVAKLFGSYQRQHLEGASADKAWQISGVAPVSAVGKVVLGYAKNSIKSTGLSDSDSSSIGLGYLHSLSKRTTLYAGYTRVNNGNNAALGTSQTSTGTTASTAGLNLPNLGGSARAIVAGVNHSF